MNKILRLTFVALLAMVASFSFAQTTITFDPATDKGANNKLKFPTCHFTGFRE